MLKIVKDTGCINAKEKIDVLNFIEEMKEQNKLEIVMITTSEKELENNYRAGYEKYLGTNQEYEYGRMDESKMDKCIVGNRETEEREEIIAHRLFGKSIEEVVKYPKPNPLRDIMIISRAIDINADYFLTVDKNFVKDGKDKWFEEVYNIKVRYVDKDNPNEKFINEIKQDLEI